VSPLFRQILFGILLVANIFYFSDILSLKARAKHAPGVVTKWFFQPGRGGGSYTVQYQFTLPNGEVRSHTTTVGTDNFFLPPVGQKLDVLYAPDNAGQVKINGFYDLWYPSVIGFLALDYLWLILFVIDRKAAKRKLNSEQFKAIDGC
jgi:hypothetical protein